MRTLVVGAGGTGGYFGGRLAEAGRDVTFLVRPARAERLRRRGLEIISPYGDATLTPQIAVRGSLGDPFELVLLCVKAYGLEQAIEDLAPAVGPETMILPVLNGMRHMDVLTARFGAERILGGVCIVAASLDDDGRVVQAQGPQDLSYGDRFDPASARISALDAVLVGAGFDARSSPHILQEMWEKWVFLASAGALTCLMRGNVSEIAAAPGGRAAAEQLLSECANVADASGFTIGSEAHDRILANITDPASGWASSMYRDLARGDRIEADHIVGDLISRAREREVPVPLLSLAFTNLSVYKQRLLGQAA